MRRGTYGEPTQKRTNPLTADYYPLAANEEFIHIHMPGDWQFVEYEGKLTWLPNIQQQPLARGVNGIKGDKDHRNPSFFIAQYQRKGGTVILPSDPRLGEKYRDYVYTIDCAEPHTGIIGKYHLTMFETPRVMGGQTRFEVDTAGWRAFLAHCVETGIVEPMSPVALDIAIERQQRRIHNQRTRAGRNPHLADALKESQSVLEQMTTRWNEQFNSKPDDVQPPPPKKKGA